MIILLAFANTGKIKIYFHRIILFSFLMNVAQEGFSSWKVLLFLEDSSGHQGLPK